MTRPWAILVVDDEPDVHVVTELALKHRRWRGRGFALVSAHSAEAARRLLADPNSPKLDVAIVDVVMETQSAGLDLCRYVRATMPPTLRVILRTGQPGAAPEEEVLNTYDIDYYLAKGDATAERLFAVVRACLRSAEDLETLRAAHASLAAGHAEAMRLGEFKERMLREFGDAKDGYIAHVAHHATLISKGKGLPRALSQSARALRDTAARMQEALRYEVRPEPTASLAEKRIVVMVSDPKLRRLALGTLAGTGAKAESAATAEACTASLNAGNFDLLYVDWENVDVLKACSPHNPHLLAVMLTTPPVFEDKGERMLTLPIASLLVTHALNATADTDAMLAEEMRVTASKLLSRDIFGLDKYLGWGTVIHQERVTRTDRRSEAIARITAHAEHCQVRQTMREKLHILADELLMNAMWDAPVDAQGRAKYARKPRSEPIELTGEEAPTVSYGSDGNLFGISVTDPFGRLERETAFRYLLKCFAKGENQIDSKAGGAGLGLYMAYLAVSAFIINVSPGRRTEVIGLLNIRSSPRDTNDRPRSFHYFRAV